MAISAEHAGRTYPPGDPMVVTAERIAAFADAIGDPDPAYRAADAPAPPTFVMSAAAAAWQAMFADPELDIALARTVHVDQAFTWARPLRAGDVIAAQLTISEVRPRGATEMIFVEVAITGEAGEQLCLVTSTLLHNRPAAA